MPQYSAFKPQPYRPRMSPYWYFDRWPYLKFMVREASCLLVAWFGVVMLVQIYAIERGDGAYAHFQALMACPTVMVVNAVALVLIAFHAVTWFVLVPRVFVRHLMGPAIPDQITAAPNFGAWLVASAVVGAFLLGLI
jgi:fumarate reductase subunit C